jgi:hypothetical protein
MKRYFIVHMYVIVNLKLHFLLRFLPLHYIYRLSQLLGFILFYNNPDLRKDVMSAITSCYPKLSTNEIKSIAYDHIIFVTFHIFLNSMVPFFSIRKFEAFFDYDNLREILEECKHHNCVIVGSHFFHSLLTTLLAHECFIKDIKLCATFGYDEALKIPYYTSKLQERFHWDYHLPITVNYSDRNDISSLRKLNSFIEGGKGVLLVFADARIKNSSSDIAYKVGNSSFYASKGFCYCSSKMKNTDLIPVHLLYKDGRFKVITAPKMSPESASTEYYNSSLPDLIRKEPAQWLLWFMASALMEN